MTSDAGPVRPPTIRTVAARAGVSKSLVSLVLQNSPRVSEQRRAAVLAAMDELGYRPDPAARSLAERRTRTVGVVLDDLTNPWYVDLLAGLRPVLHEHGLRPLLADGATEPDAVAALTDLRVDGIVVVGTPSDPVVEQVLALGDVLPVVVAGTRESRLGTADIVANDDDAGARLATAHLLEQGHRRISHIVGRGEVGGLRREGHVATMRAADLAQHCVDGDWTEETGHRLAHELLTGPDRPTAILAANDRSAVGVLTAADELGLAVPGELSVVGYDDTVLARLPRLSLTTVDSHIAEVGQAAGEALCARLAGDDPGAPTTRLITPALVVRGSTGPAR
ncbi:LacI family DNA-binding transcriptional regulator [Pseudonocardia humida]|uniref:LacI family DNA-binding transcriptional regulator n=1 Tax=Pseudonocardia humida TaxID=2800819 RepID=A0ABT1A3W9_9PSEU|nr:LacI family DNA-binding transcriptional regulator [Pseudonocardia humida]MCO1657686.1 LacI family DNA-binding transcriptional regulator [Pseudonocardia humida]